jgi:hypothetical protein
MGVRENIVKWVFASACKQFTDNISGIDIYIEGQPRDTNSLSDWCELRVDGPWIREISKDLLKITCEINILVGTHIEPTDLYKETTNINAVVPAFTDFDVYKYGAEAADTGDFVGRLKLQPMSDVRDRIEVSKFGRLTPSTPLMQATVEGHYELVVDN